MSIGFLVNSLANFPIDYKITELMVRLGDRVPKKEHNLDVIYNIPAGGRGWYYSHGITTEGMIGPDVKVVEGTFSFTLQYGNSKNELKHTFYKKREIKIKFDNEGKFQSGTSNDI